MVANWPRKINMTSLRLMWQVAKPFSVSAKSLKSIQTVHVTSCKAFLSVRQKSSKSLRLTWQVAKPFLAYGKSLKSLWFTWELAEPFSLSVRKSSKSLRLTWQAFFSVRQKLEEPTINVTSLFQRPTKAKRAYMPGVAQGKRLKNQRLITDYEVTV